MDDLGLLNDYELEMLDISYDDFEEIDDNMINKIEKYRDQKK